MGLGRVEIRVKGNIQNSIQFRQSEKNLRSLPFLRANYFTEKPLYRLSGNMQTLSSDITDMYP